jgi:hypothetical protein
MRKLQLFWPEDLKTHLFLNTSRTDETQTFSSMSRKLELSILKKHIKVIVEQNSGIAYRAS